MSAATNPEPPLPVGYIGAGPEVRLPRIVRGANVTIEVILGPIPDEGVHDECCLFVGDDDFNDVEIQGSIASIKAIGEAILRAVEKEMENSA